MKMLAHVRTARAVAIMLATALLAGCASTISPDRHDFALVEGRVELRGWNCGTVPREGGGYFYVCDVPITVHRVVLGQHADSSVVARYFAAITEHQDEIFLGPDPRRDRRVAAILWRRDDGMHSYVLMGRWCVPDWMVTELGISSEETAQLRRAGYPLCSLDTDGQ